MLQVREMNNQFYHTEITYQCQCLHLSWTSGAAVRQQHLEVRLV